MEDDVLIRVENVSKSYRIVKSDPSENGSRKTMFKRKTHEVYNVFHDLNLEVRKGEVVGILGTNGCGKSTFLKILSRILKPDTGTVTTKGKIVGILELSMGFHPDLSGYENIFLRSELYGIRRSEVEKNIDNIIRYADLGDYIHNPVRTYSSGMRSRLAFAVMINVDADVYLIDEALSTGDAKFASKASEHIKNLVRKGKTIMLVSHSMGTIENTCDRAIWLCDHTIHMDGPAETVCAEYNRSLFDSFEDILQLAEDGSPSAQYRLACCYRDGDKTEQNPEEYRRWLNEASLRDHTLAMSEYADLLMNEDRVGNAEKAADLYARAADKGNYEARRKYSALVSDAYGELDVLRDAFLKIAESGHPDDLYSLGNLLYKTALTTDQYAEAAEYVRRSAEGGNPDALYLMGIMYREGTGVQRDIDAAIDMFAKASDAGNQKAPATLATMYEDGKLVARNMEEAFRWYLRSAENGNAKSQYQIAVMYRDGDGTAKDPAAAEKWFSTYARSLLSEFRLEAAEKISKRRIVCDADPSVLIDQAAECGNSRAARMSERRKQREAGMVQVDDSNIETQRSLADSGNAFAMYNVAIYYKGRNEPGSQELYRDYMKSAAENGNRKAQEVVRKWESRNRQRRSRAPEAEAAPVTADPHAEELFAKAMELKESGEPGSMNEYRRLVREAAECGHPEASKLVAKWDRRAAKREKKSD